MEIMHKGMWTGRRVLYLSVDAIRANPDQPRKYFEPEALRVMVERGCNVAQAEAYIESVLQRAAVTPPRRRPTFIVKDVRLFLNTIRRSMGIMQRAGVDAAYEREDTDEEIRLTIRIPRTGAAKTA